MSVRVTRLLSSLVLVLAAGCGGGGGGGGDGGGNGGEPPAPPPPSSSGLLPDAPVVGATLYSDGVALRGLKDGAVMTYRGSDPGSQVYENTVSNAATADGFAELQGNPQDSGQAVSTILNVADGAVTESGVIQLTEDSKPEPVVFTHIRSPVKINDRYVHLDRHYDDAGFDADGDGKNETLDLASWSQVIGTETLDLHQRRQVSAVRVDDMVRMRVRYSSDGQYSDVVEFRGSKWMAMGLGIVKVLVDVPGETGRQVYAEELVNRDAIDSGLGYTAASQPMAPAGSNIAGQAILTPTEAAAFGDHVTAFSASSAADPGFVLTQLDLRGQAMASRLHRFSELFGAQMGEARMAKVGEGLRVVAEADAGLKMVGFDATGQQVTIATPVQVTSEPLNRDLDGHMFSLAGTADSLWVSWLTYGEYTDNGWDSQLRLRRFDAAGHPTSEVLTLRDGVQPGGLSGVGMAESAGRMLVVWAESSLQGKQWHYAMLSSSTGVVLANQSLGADCAEYFVAQSAISGPVLSCTGHPFAGIVSFDTEGHPKRAGDGTVRIDGGLPGWWTQDQGPLNIAVGDDSAIISGYQYDPFWPTDVQDSSFTQIGQMPMPDGVAQGADTVILAKMPFDVITPVRLVPYADRIVVVGTDCWCQGGKLRTLVVWRP